MIVWNTFQNDARVLKEAETLAGQGHRVTVFALLQPGETPEHEVLAPGLEVVRVSRTPMRALRRLFQPDGSRPPRAGGGGRQRRLRRHAAQELAPAPGRRDPVAERHPRRALPRHGGEPARRGARPRRQHAADRLGGGAPRQGAARLRRARDLDRPRGLPRTARGDRLGREAADAPGRRHHHHHGDARQVLRPRVRRAAAAGAAEPAAFRRSRARHADPRPAGARRRASDRSLSGRPAAGAGARGSGGGDAGDAALPPSLHRRRPAARRAQDHGRRPGAGEPGAFHPHPAARRASRLDRLGRHRRAADPQHLPQPPQHRFQQALRIRHGRAAGGGERLSRDPPGGARPRHRPALRPRDPRRAGGGARPAGGRRGAAGAAGRQRAGERKSAQLGGAGSGPRRPLRPGAGPLLPRS